MSAPPSGSRRRLVELLAPAGNFEKLETAIHYGADAVYLAGKAFSLRDYSGNFTRDELAAAVALARGHQVRVYVACNIYPRDSDMGALREFLSALRDIRPDGLIIADPGVAVTAQEEAPEIPLHISTQANTTHTAAVRFWHRFGAVRINAARELSLEEIGRMVRAAPMEIEVFLHGAMCVAYSGRCLLSTFMAGRDSNRGKCAHPCRWEYGVVERMRPGQVMPVTADGHGSYVFNSRDLCMIEHLPALISTGVAALKIEGRMKGAHYLATVLKTYREAIDRYLADPAGYRCDPLWVEALHRVHHRGYCTGFYLGDPEAVAPDTRKQALPPPWRFAGKVLKGPAITPLRIEVRNKIQTGDTIELVPAQGALQRARVKRLFTADGEPVDVVQPGSIAEVDAALHAEPMDLIRVHVSPSADTAV
jgi:putative protease